MEKMHYAEELVREFLVFRGFTTTLQSYETELRSDVGKSFHVDKILDLIFSIYIPNFHIDKLISLLSFFKHYLSSSSQSTLLSSFSKLEASILRFYVVHALQSSKREKVVEFFDVYGPDLLQSSQEDWTQWFAIPYVKNPRLDPQFRVFFGKEWNQALHLSVRNFFSQIFNATRLPALLKISSEMNSTNLLKREITQLNIKLSELQALLNEKETQLRQFRSMEGSISSSSNLREESTHVSKDSPEIDQDLVVGEPGNVQSEFISSKSGDDSTFILNDYLEHGRAGNTTLKGHDSPHIGRQIYFKAASSV